MGIRLTNIDYNDVIDNTKNSTNQRTMQPFNDVLVLFNRAVSMWNIMDDVNFINCIVRFAKQIMEDCVRDPFEI